MVTVLPNGMVKWEPPLTDIERVATFITRYAAAQPKPLSTSHKVTLKNFVGEDNRWPCFGGPMDGQGISKAITLSKGAGKKKILTTFVPSSTIHIRTQDETVNGFYQFDDGRYVWHDHSAPVKQMPDPWADENYWKRYKEKYTGGQAEAGEGSVGEDDDSSFDPFTYGLDDED